MANAVRPWGNPHTATILVIGHDPRLQRSQAEAECASFLEYLERPRPARGPEARKYELAHAVWRYVQHLAGRDVPLAELYVTNLCNQFLPPTPGSQTVLIPDDLADHGVQEIATTVATGRFRVILPMAVQTFYHLCRTGFVEERSEQVARFLAAARPHPSKAEQGVYVQTGKSPFIAVCGGLFHHRGVPVVPIVHVKQWPLKPQFVKYVEPMQMAQQHVQAALRRGGGE